MNALRIAFGAGPRRGEELDAFLQFECGNDESLQREVREVLDRADRARSAPTPVHQRGPAPPASTQVGVEIVPGHQFVEELGKGGMGVVYKVWDSALRRTVALKMLKSEALVNPQAVARFRQEATTAAGLNHPNIVKVFQTHEVGPRSDVYALGAILYRCLAGRPPFVAETEVGVLKLIQHREPMSLHSLNASVPRELDVICLKCLQKVPGQRYQSARELADDLRRYQEGRPVLARPIGPLGRTWKLARRHPLVSVSIAIALLALLGGTGASTRFAIQADYQKKQALQAVSSLEDSLATGLLRPLGPYTNETKLNEFELFALLDLANLPPERDRVRLLFIEKGLEPVKASQLARRFEPAMIAAMGLRQDLRKQALERVTARLSEAPADPEGTLDSVRVTSALVLAQLAVSDPDTAFQAATALLPWVSSLSFNPEGGLRLEAFIVLAGKVTPKKAEELARHIVGQSKARSFGFELEAISKGLGALARRLPPQQAERLVSPVAETIVKEIEKPSDIGIISAQGPDPGAPPAHTGGGGMRAALCEAFARLAPFLPVRQRSNSALRISKSLLREIEATKDTRDLSFLAKAVVTLVPFIHEKERIKSVARSCQILARQCATCTSPVDLQELAASFGSLARQAALSELSSELGVVSKAILLSLQKLRAEHALAQSLDMALPVAILAPSLSSEERSGLAKSLLEIGTSSEDPVQVKTVGRTLEVVAGELPIKVVDSGIDALAATIEGGKAGDFRTWSLLLARARLFSLAASRLPPKRTSKHIDRIASVLMEFTRTNLQTGQLSEASEGVEALSNLPGWDGAGQLGPVFRLLREKALLLRQVELLLPVARACVAVQKRFPNQVPIQSAVSLVRQLLRCSSSYQQDEVLVKTVGALTEKAPLQDLNDLLKEPGCIGQLRTRLFRSVERQMKLSSPLQNTWELVESLEGWPEVLDVITPPPPLEAPPEARPRDIVI
jgi:hypothetical protein